MSGRTYHASVHTPGKPYSVTFQTKESEDIAKARAEELGLTMQAFIDEL